jgi:antitoxin MazE9
MKVSVSLPDDDLAYIDDYARRLGNASRSSVLRRAIGLLRMTELENAYAAAWDEWESSDDSRLWEKTVADGVADAAR